MEDRSAETFAEWLRQHPGVEIISRDRSREYQRGATDGAPQAQQVIDRWHLLKNLREAIERFLSHTPVPEDAHEAAGLAVSPRAIHEPVASGSVPRDHESDGLRSISR